MTDNDKMREAVAAATKIVKNPHGYTETSVLVASAFLEQAAKSVPDAGKACQIPVVGEPVAWINAEKLSKVRKGYLLNVYLHGGTDREIDNLVPLYSAPPKSVPVIGEPVAYRVEKLDQDPVYKYCFQEADWFLPDEIGECQEPLYLKPASSITAAELERLRKDAERYRWLRSPSVGPATVWNVCMEPMDGGLHTLKSDSCLDEAIDAAIVRAAAAAIGEGMGQKD